MTSPRPSLPALVTGVCGLLALVLLATPPRRPLRGPHQEPLLPREEVLRVVGRGYLQLVADYFWIQLVQTTGAARDANDYLDIAPYAELITDLDPRFEMVYSFAGGSLPVNLGRETWVNTEQSTRLLRKGLKLFPNDLRILMLLAYNLSSFHHQYREAAELLERASKLPDAPAFLPQLATRLYAQSGGVEAGLALASSLAESSPDEATREMFRKRVQQLELEGELQRVDHSSQRFSAVFGVPPPDVATLLWLGYLERPPQDPEGGRVHIGDDGRAYSDSEQRRLEIFTPTNR